MKDDAFHEWPLVVFTTLATMGAGLLTAPLVATVVATSSTAAPLLLLGVALLTAGLLVSLAHLGQPVRSPLALARVGRSRLSSEIALAGAALLTGTGAVMFADASLAITLLSAVFALAFLLALGLVYRLPGQLTWGGPVVLSPLVLGIGFGALGLLAAPDGSSSSVAPLAAVLIADIGVFVVRCRGILAAGQAGALPAIRAGKAEASPASYLLAVRFALVDVLPACLLLAHLPKGAAGVLGLGILADRLSFYLLAARRTTETEIAAVEDAMDRT